MAPETKEFAISRFKGLNLVDSAANMQEGELLECKNWEIDPSGALVKRGSFRYDTALVAAGVGSGALIVGRLTTASLDHLVIAAGTKTYFLDLASTSGVGTVIAGGVGNQAWGVQYQGKLYLINSNAIMGVWDGAAYTTIAGSPQGQVAAVYKDRMFVADSNNAVNPNRLWWSAPGDFSTAGWAALANFTDIGDSADPIIGLVVIHDFFLILKRNSCWYLSVTPDLTGWSTRIAHPTLGLIDKWSVKLYENNVYFMATGQGGLYRTDGYSFTELSKKVSPYFSFWTFGAANIALAAYQDKIICQIGYSFEASGGGVPGQAGGPYRNSRSTILVYYIKLDVWVEWNFVAGSTIQIQNFWEVNSRLYAGGGNDGGTTAKVHLYQQRYVNDIVDSVSYSDDWMDNGGTERYVSSLTTKQLDFDNPMTLKRLKRVYADFKSSSSTPPTMDFYRDDSLSTLTLSVAMQDLTARRAIRDRDIPQKGDFFRVGAFRFFDFGGTPIVFYGFTGVVTDTKRPPMFTEVV